MQKFIKSHKNYLLFVVIVMGIGILAGILYYQFLDQNVKNNIVNTLANYQTFKNNNIVKDIIITSILLVSSFFIIGLPISLFYLFYESVSFGFILNIFFVSYKIKGIIYFLIYFIINKLLILLLIILLIKKIINISRYIIGYIIYKKDSTIKNKIMENFKKSLYIIIIILVVDIILYFISPFILNRFTFLIK